MLKFKYCLIYIALILGLQATDYDNLEEENQQLDEKINHLKQQLTEADVAFNYIDEWLHRDEFKKEILNNINEMKKNLKESYKISFDNSITKFSQEFQKDLKNIETISVKAYVEKLK